MKKVLGLLAALAIGAHAQNYTNWNGHYQVTVNATAAGVAAPLTNYPLLLKITSSTILDQAQANGTDIRFSSWDEQTEYPYEIEHWVSGATDTAIIWVLVPALSTADGQKFKLHVGNAAMTTPVSNGAAVFAPANGWVGVWHMNKAIASATDTVYDVTGNKLHAVPAHSNLDFSFPVVDIVGRGYNLGGTNGTTGRYFNVVLANVDTTLAAGFLSTDAANLTLSAWASSSNCQSGTRQTMIGKYQGTGTGAGERQLGLQNAGSGSNWSIAVNPTSYGASAGANEFVAQKPCNSLNGQVAYVAGTYQGLPASRDAAGAYSSNRVYINGDSTGSSYGSASQTSSQIGRVSPLRIGAGGNAATPNRFLLGSIDEVRISNVVRSASWIKLDYETQKAGDVSSVVTVGTIVDVKGALKASLHPSPITSRVTGNNVTFVLGDNAYGTLSILDIHGRTMFSREVSMVENEVSWTGSKGVYFARFNARNNSVRFADHKFSIVK